MCKRTYSMTAFVFATCILFFCFSSKECWAKTYSPNVHWTFCIDTSGSMKKKGHMDLLKLITGKITKEFLGTKKNIINPGDRITIFSFDEDVRLEVTSLYQTESDILPVKDRLKKMNNRNGSLTFISEAIVQAIDFTIKYNQFFHTNAVYVFTDGRSEPYSPKWPHGKIAARKKRDMENFKKISLSGKDQGLNVWVGVLRWEAIDDAKSLVRNLGKGGHLVDLTDFNRLSLERALKNFAQTVRSKVMLAEIEDMDFGTVPYRNSSTYQKSISVGIQTDKIYKPPSIVGRISFDPDNPSVLPQDYPLEIMASDDKMVLNFNTGNLDRLKAGTYRGKLGLFPSERDYGALVIEPSQLNIMFKKAGFLSFYAWKFLMVFVIGFFGLCYLISKVRRKMPIRIKA